MQHAAFHARSNNAITLQYCNSQHTIYTLKYIFFQANGGSNNGERKLKTDQTAQAGVDPQRDYSLVIMICVTDLSGKELFLTVH